MSYSRLDITEDIWNNRNWAADSESDLASIPGRHGDLARATDTGIWYLYAGGVWVALTEYEIGTWQPDILFGGGGIGRTYTTQLGTYIKLNDLVITFGRFVLSAIGASTGAVTLSNFPFNALTSGSYVTLAGGIEIHYGANLANLTSPISGKVEYSGGVTTASLYDWGATGAAALDESNFTNTSELRFTAIYRTDS